MNARTVFACAAVVLMLAVGGAIADAAVAEAGAEVISGVDTSAAALEALRADAAAVLSHEGEFAALDADADEEVEAASEAEAEADAQADAEVEGADSEADDEAVDEADDEADADDEAAVDETALFEADAEEQSGEKELSEGVADDEEAGEDEDEAEAEDEDEAEDETEAVSSSALIETEKDKRKKKGGGGVVMPKSAFGWKKSLKANAKCGCPLLQRHNSRHVKYCKRHCKKLDGCNSVNFNAVTAICELRTCKIDRASGYVSLLKKPEPGTRCHWFIAPPVNPHAAPPAKAKAKAKPKSKKH